MANGIEISDLWKAIVPKYAARWKDLGTQLKIPEHHLDAIAVNKVNHPSYSAECCKAMLQKWMEITPDATWDVLEAATECLPVYQTSYKGEKNTHTHAYMYVCII